VVGKPVSRPRIFRRSMIILEKSQIQKMLITKETTDTIAKIKPSGATVNLVLNFIMIEKMIVRPKPAY
jgi:aspartate carbamoyltransferase regulatory subunit